MLLYVSNVDQYIIFGELQGIIPDVLVECVHQVSVGCHPLVSFSTIGGGWLGFLLLSLPFSVALTVLI